MDLAVKTVQLSWPSTYCFHQIKERDKKIDDKNMNLAVKTAHLSWPSTFFSVKSKGEVIWIVE